MGPLPDPPANPAMGRKPMQNLRRFKRVTATINGVFPMPASAWVGKPSRQASGARSRNLPARHSGIARDYLSTAKCPVGPTFPRICPLFETQRKRSIAAARKAADGGMAQDRSQGGPHVPRLCGRTPPAAAGFRAADPSQRYSPDARAAPTVSRSCRGVSRVVADQAPSRPNELLRVHSSPVRRHACTAASTTRLGHGRTVRDALQKHFGTEPNSRQREDSGQQRARHRSRFPIGHSRIIIRRR
jgi:hypothetical protein